MSRESDPPLFLLGSNCSKLGWQVAALTLVRGAGELIHDEGLSGFEKWVVYLLEIALRW